MDWPLVIAWISIVMGLVGYGLVVFMTFKLARDVRWKQAYLSEQPGRWSVPRRVVMTGLALMALCWLGLVIQMLIRGRLW
jgi:hypothetical protein